MPGLHFVIGNSVEPEADFLPEDLFNTILDRMPVCTLDILVLNAEGEALVVKRTQEPAKGKLAMPGGRIRRGESFQIAASRLLSEECKIVVEPDRFQWLGANSFLWGIRQQPPQENGSHTISQEMKVNLTPSELESPQLDTQLAPAQWIQPQDAIDNPDPYDPVFVQLCKDYLATKPANP